MGWRGVSQEMVVWLQCPQECPSRSRSVCPPVSQVGRGRQAAPAAWHWAPALLSLNLG